MKWIGIDPGTKTGVAVWDDKSQRLVSLYTLSIHEALFKVYDMAKEDQICVIFEDARQRTWYGNDRPSSAKLQGAGSVKRDCSIWEDFLTDYDISFRAIPPQKGCTKWTESYFRMVTKWRGRTSNHARDAAMLVFGK